jgi:transcriptional regulator with PAS, ATPase and Fis domain
MIREGTFREDLYYRINVFPIRLPSLRERMSDLPYLVEGILQANAAKVGSPEGPPELHPTVLERLRRHHWPGNVRELENVILRAAIMAEGGPIGVEHLPRLTAQTVEAAAVRSAARRKGDVLRPLKEVEREHIADVLRVKEGNIKASAKVLGISRTTLYKKIKRYKIDLDAIASSA